MAAPACFRVAPRAPKLTQSRGALAARSTPPNSLGNRAVVARSSSNGAGPAAAAATEQRTISPTSPLLPKLELHKVVGHNRGRTSPWSSMLPDAHDVLPAFMEEVVNKHLHAPLIIDWLDGVYMMLSKERAGADTFLSAALPHDAPRLPLHSEPDASYYLMGWCLVNRRLDPRITAIEFIEVPVEVRRHGMGRALLELLSASYPDQAVLPHEPRDDCLRFWLEVTPPSLGKLIEEHGVSVARDICVASLGWQPRYFEAMMERHREAVATGNISD